MKLMEGYRSFLASLDLSDVNDLIVEAEDKKPVYFKYNGVKRRLALPTSRMIKNGMVDDQEQEVHAIHPLCEDVLRGESGTVRYFKQRIRWCFLKKTLSLLSTIVDIKVSKKIVRSIKFTNFLANALGDVKGVQWDDKLSANVNKAIESLLASKPEELCTVYITNKQKIDGDMYLRVANVNTFMDELDEEGVYFFETKLSRKVDKVVIYRLLKALTEWMPVESGSNDDCPYFGCLARLWFEYIRNYNNLARIIDEVSTVKPVPQNFIMIIDEMPRYRNLIQQLPYNTGPRSGTTEAKVSEYRLGTSAPASLDVQPERASTVDADGDIFAMLGRPKSEARVNGMDITSLSPAEQDVWAGKAELPRGSVLDRRLTPEPVASQNTSILDRVGLQNRSSILDSSPTARYRQPTGSPLDNYGGGVSLDGFKSTDPFAHFNQPTGGGLNTDFFK